MKRILIFFSPLLALLFPICVFAQSVQIIDVRGQVQVKKDAVSTWQKAEINMLLGKECELMTQDKSSCTLAFDKEKKNILTIKENSHIKIENVSPGNLFLSEGRVFSLIKNLTKTEEFRIRTPVAVAGARATGWATEYRNGAAFVYCFEDTVYILAMDKEGNITKAIDLESGFGIDIDIEGRIGKILELTPDEIAEWNDFKGLVESLSEKMREEGAEKMGLELVESSSEKMKEADAEKMGLEEERTEDVSGSRDLRQEGREDYREEQVEKLRKDEEEKRAVEKSIVATP